jgi:hypothetical protein
MHGDPTSDGEKSLLFALLHAALAQLTTYTPCFWRIALEYQPAGEAAGVQHAVEGHFWKMTCSHTTLFQGKVLKRLTRWLCTPALPQTYTKRNLLRVPVCVLSHE